MVSSSKSLKFYPKSHTYKLNGKKLISVTTFVGQFFDEFDAKGIARKLAKFPANKAKKQGVRYFLSKWKESRDFGTKVYKDLEVFVKNDFK